MRRMNLSEAVEVRPEDTIYLVKVGVRLVKAMEDYGDDNEEDFDEDTEATDMNFEDE